MARYQGMRALVLGLELNGLHVVRDLGRAGVRVVGVDSNLEQTSALSKYVLARCRTEDIRGPSVVETLVSIAADGQRYAVFPTMDATVQVLSDGRDRLPENLVLRLPDQETVRCLLHKGCFRQKAQALGLEGIRHALVKDESELVPALDSIRFPMIIKSPVKRWGAGPKAARIGNRDEALAAYRIQGGGEAILEEWIPGGDGDVYFCLQAYGARSELLASFTGRKIRQWPPLVGGTASAEPVENPELEERTKRFFQAQNFQGLCSMEYKYDSRNGKYYAIEPTVGRTDFQSGIAPANGVRLPLILFREMAGSAPRPVRRSRRPVKWVNPLGDTLSAAYYLERGELTREEWRRSLSGPRVTSLFAFDDPAPWVSDLFRRALGRMKRLLRQGNRKET